MTIDYSAPPLVAVGIPDRCLRCDYDLRGINDEQPCPECGLLAIRSRRPSDELRDARPGWLRGLAVGIWMILLSVVFTSLLPFLQEMAYEQMNGWFRDVLWTPTAQTRYATYMQAIDVTAAAIQALAAVVFFVGIFLLTRPEGFPPADQADRPRRILIRLAAIAPVLAVTLIVYVRLVNSFYLMFGNRDVSTVVTWILLLLTVGCVPLPMLGMSQLRSLAYRARSRGIAEHCTIVGWGTSITLLYICGMYFLFKYANDLGLHDNWTSRSQVSLLLMLFASTAGFLFLLWFLFLSIRFAIKFGKASRELRRAWREADRAA